MVQGFFLNFDEFCTEIFNSKVFVDASAAGIQRGLSTIYIKRNFFHQSRIGPDVELHYMHIVLLKSSHDVMQVSTLNAQLGLASKLVGCYWDAKSVPYGQVLIDLSPRTDDRYVIVQTVDPSHQNCRFRDSGPIETIRFLVDEHTKFFYSLCVPTNFTQMQISFVQFCPNFFLRFLRMHGKFAQRKPAKQKKKTRGKISKQSAAAPSKKINLKAKKRQSSVQKRHAT